MTQCPEPFCGLVASRVDEPQAQTFGGLRVTEPRCGCDLLVASEADSHSEITDRQNEAVIMENLN